jgi:hypothetical protein
MKVILHFVQNPLRIDHAHCNACTFTGNFLIKKYFTGIEPLVLGVIILLGDKMLSAKILLPRKAAQKQEHIAHFSGQAIRKHFFVSRKYFSIPWKYFFVYQKYFFIP